MDLHNASESTLDQTDHILHNPLGIDLKQAVQNFLSLRGPAQFAHQIDSSVLENYTLKTAHVPTTLILDKLSQCLLVPEWTRTVVTLFRPLIIDLVARWNMPGFTAFLENARPSTGGAVNRIELIAKAYSAILPVVPQAKSLAVTYFTHSPSLLERLHHIKHPEHLSSEEAEDLQDLLLTTYRLLLFSTSAFVPFWNWSLLVQLLHCNDTPVRYYTILCLSKVYGLSDAQRQSLLTSIAVECDSNTITKVDGTPIDLRMITLWEAQKLAEAQIAFAQNNFSTDVTGNHSVKESDLCPLTCNLCGVLIPRSTEPQDRSAHSSQLILTETTMRNLHALCLALSIGAPTLLEGVTGAGKTSLVEELALRTGRSDKLIKIHLGDQTDPKVLLGTYVSTSTVGSFRWQAGVLTTAVQEGRWVLIEDIDLAPAEVISILLPLLETRHLFIPSRGEKIKAKEGFQLFGTRSFLPSRSGKGVNSRGNELVTGANLWTKVRVEALSMNELEQVVRKKFKHIGSFSVHVMRLFESVVGIYQDPNFSALTSSTMGRHISTRDLMKWCYRIDTLLGEKLNGNGKTDPSMDLDIRQDLFSEAVDCFTGMISNYSTWRVVLQRIGEPLQISPEMVDHYVDQYKPTLDLKDDTVRVGRVNLTALAAQGKHKQKQALVKRSQGRPFATTTHALRLLEKISVCVHLNEPVLLVGETGTGKTTVVQHLADMMHQNLVVVNLSQQSDSSDLLGGFKPVEGRILAIPIKEDFDRLFEKTFSLKKNAKFVDMVRKMFVHQKWKHFVALLQQSIKMAQQKFEGEHDDGARKVSSPEIRNAWKKFAARVDEFEIQQVQSQNKFVFNFIEGSLVKAVRQGDWILLDEINLATTETLECLSGLLQDAEGSLLLTEKGDVEPIKRHPNFRLFACMNPATDVGKRDLPPGLRNRFTEFYVHPPDANPKDLLQIVQRYLYSITTGDEGASEDVAKFYMEAKQLSQQHQLVDGANQRPHFSLRTLSRALTFVNQINSTFGLRRSLYEGFCMTFLTQLDKTSEALMRKTIYNTILRSVKNPTHLVSQIPRQPAEDYIQFGYFWLKQGQFEPVDDGNYILTPSVETNLYNLARVIMSRKFPVLIQGPTSAGKTSMIEYLAKKTGHRFVRINNHEHTDLQEYLGTYVSNNEGKLVFQEGVLVEALRNGYWIVLDELNLAPSDVLEALNRLLDDNRELLIPETQEIVKPHPHFMLFATQNPAGLYGGRKALSRAFRNRFLELHFDDIPQDELEQILSMRCKIAPSYCKKLVQVYKMLMERRKSSRIFEQKHSFITLRDLFRWAGRDPNGYQELAEHGYMLLAERCRKNEEKLVVKHVLETVMKVKLNEDEMYNCERLEEFAVYDRILKERAAQSGTDTKLVWTKAMRRLFSLVARCLRFKEPVLLVGETGCGKTTVCQMLAETFNRELHIVNCHQNTETADLLGGQRPVRNHDDPEKKNQLFEWHDGPLVQALKEGHLFLLDEISLADDSVLERLNSVLEPSRLLVLAEKGGKHVEELYGQESFQFLATMNPGGDYGKKELSPALRNRFTEIWVPSVTDRDDLTMIIDEQLMAHPDLRGYGSRMLDFIEWYTHSLGLRVVVSLRDILSWVRFINACVGKDLDPNMSFIHGGCLVLLDGLGSHGASGSFLTGHALQEFREKCLRKLAGNTTATEQELLGNAKMSVNVTEDQFAIGPFQIARGPLMKTDIKFTLLAPTTADNAMRVVRAMQLPKPILLEGSPGVGKTSLISALAAASGHQLVRINLSEQTDLMDLFGSDLPVEGGNSGEFAWRDAPFLQAMKAGHWVLLDELNLASQSVLEGLNSCLDHRGAVYIPELDREFFCAQGFRVFGAQNPLQQGGGRKGLPKSFVNRFTQVYVEHLTAEDLLFICAHLFPQFEPATLKLMIQFNSQMYEETMIRCRFGRKGSPWEFNLRDVFRWLELMRKDNICDPAEYLATIYLQRMRTNEDKQKVIQLYEQVFQQKYDRLEYPSYEITTDQVCIGHSVLRRELNENAGNDVLKSDSHILHTFLSPLEALMKCVESSWMAIVTGPSASGKTSLVRLLSRMTGNRLEEFAMNNSVDTMELLGGFEQVDLSRHRQTIIASLEQLVSRLTKAMLMHLNAIKDDHQQRNQVLQHIRKLSDTWFNLKAKHEFSESAGSFDYNLIVSLMDNLRVATSVDENARSLIDSLTMSLDKLQNLEKSSVAGKFEWIDGLLINALEQGHWLLIDNANLCNPSVLDRLNPLFENDGVLMVNERGLVDGEIKVIKPHPNFRMFMTVDPANGELSRAMRNRGIEIALVNPNWHENNMDLLKLSNAMGLRGAQLPIVLGNIQQEALSSRRSFGRGTNVRDYLMFATYIVERLQRGQSLKQAVLASFQQCFVDAKELPESLVKFLDGDASEDAFKQLFSPGNCPYLIDGSLTRLDSKLARVSLQGAYLIYLLQQSQDIAENQRRVKVAANYLLESFSIDDYGLYLCWLEFMAKHAVPTGANTLSEVAKLMQALWNHPVFRECKTTQGSDTDRRMEKGFHLLIRLFQVDLTDAKMQDMAGRLKLGNMTALQQSYSYHQGRLNDSQLSHPIVKKILPLFKSIRNAMFAWLDEASYRTCPVTMFDVLHRILDARDFAFEITQSQTLSLDNYLNVLRIIAQLIPNEYLYANEALELIADIMSGFDFETCKSMKALWQHYCPATLSLESLHTVEQKLQRISASLDVYRLDLQERGLTSDSLVLRVSSAMKDMFIEGVATLYAIDGSNDKSATKLAKSLEHLPEHLEHELESVQEANETTLWDTALVPLYDHASVVKEMQLISELYLVACYHDDQALLETLVDKMKSFKSFAVEKSSRPPLDLVPYQRLIWFLDSDYAEKIASLFPGMVQDAAHVWHRRLWLSSVAQQSLYQIGSSLTPVHTGISEGSANLFESVETSVCLNVICSMDKMSAEAYGNALKQIKALQGFLSVNVNLTDRKASDLVMVTSMAHQMLIASESMIHPDIYKSVSIHFIQSQAILKTLATADMYSLQRNKPDCDLLFSSLSNVSALLQNNGFNALYVSAITILCEAVRAYQSDNGDMFLTSIGRARILLGLSFITAYIPDYAVDPTSEPRLRVNLLMDKRQALEDQISVRREIESMITGNDTNLVISACQEELEQVETQLSQSVTKFSLRPAKTQLEDIFVDLRYLQKHLLSSNVETLVEDLITDGTTTASQREDLLQGNILQFIDRVHAKYPLYRDILQPLLVAVDDIKYGLRIIASVKKDNVDTYLAQVVELLIRSPDSATCFPFDLDWPALTDPLKLSKLKAIVFERAPTSRKWAFYLRVLIVILQRLVMTISRYGCIRSDDLESLNALFHEIVQIWKAAQEYKRQKEIEKEQLFKTRAKKYEPPTEEEQEEADMKKTFADFNEVFADLDLEETREPPKQAEQLKVEEESVLDDDDVHYIGNLHKVIFESFHTDRCYRANKSWDREILRSYTLAGQLASMTGKAFSHEVDYTCNTGHLRATSLAIRRLESGDSFSMTNEGLYDFYTSENVGEAKRVEPILRRFKARVVSIANEWPEHAVLEQLIVICDRVLGFSIVSPVAKFLTGLELLLQKSEDWEAYAAKHVSLKAQREEVIQLIVSWRQLELNCWPKLLAAQEQYHQRNAYTWWFHLYDAVNNTSFESGTDSDRLNKKKDLIGALDHFMQSSTLVEYEPRLKMMDSFYRHSRMQAEFTSDPDAVESHRIVANLLRNAFLYYQQFEDHVKTMLAQLRKPIEKDLKDFVKIATWKDVNIYALKQSAYKTHKQLHKCIRKYREVLNTPMMTVIANYNQEHAMYQYGDEKRYSDNAPGLVDQLSQPAMWLSKTTVPSLSADIWPEESALKTYLANLPRTFAKLGDYCRKDLFVLPDQSLPLENFMTEMIQQIKTFQKETPAILTEENKAQVKNQKLIKKRALVDFLKELSRLGLEMYSGAKRAVKNADTARLFSQRPASLEHILQRQTSTGNAATSDMLILWNKANDYYFRCISRMTHLRTISTTEASKDLSLREVELSMSATEHMFALVKDERQIASRFETGIHLLQAASVQFASLNDSCRRGIAVTSDTSLSQHLISHKLRVDDLTQMLMDCVKTLQVQSEYTTVPTHLLESMTDIERQTLAMQRATDTCFVKRYLSVQGAWEPVLTEDIQDMLKEHEDIMDDIGTRLLQIAQQVPQMSHPLHSVIRYIDHTKFSVSTQDDAINEPITLVETRDKLYRIIQAIQTSVQELKKQKDEMTLSQSKSEESDEEELMAQGYITREHTRQQALVQALGMNQVVKQCVAALTAVNTTMRQNVSETDKTVLGCLLQQVHPFVQQYSLLVQHTLGQFILHHKSMAKLTYALVNSFTIIISKGFCMPEGADDDEEGDAEGMTAGTGIGEGEGSKDVSKEIEDEEQVLGTQNEEPAKNENPETKEEKEGLEMENDFEGQMEDIEKDDEGEESSDDDEDEEKDLDEEIGDVDDMDPDAVDDKMWGDDQEERKESDKTVDQQGQSEQQESDIVAKEEEEENAVNQDTKGENPEPSKENAEQENGEGDEGDEDGDEEGDEDGQEDGEQEEEQADPYGGEQMNVEIPEAETLELPDDLNMDGDGEEEQAPEQGEDFDGMDIDEEKPEGPEEEEGEAFEDPLNKPEQGEPENPEDETMEESDALAQMESEEKENEENKKEGEDAKEEEEETKLGDPEQQQQQQGGQMDEDEEMEQDSKAQNREHPNSDASADQQFGVQGEAGKMSMTSAGEKQGADEKTESAEAEDQQKQRQENSGMAEQGANQADQNELEETQKETQQKTNPQRSLGDALEDWRRRLGNVADAEDEEEELEGQERQDKNEEREARVNEENAFEYIKNDDEAHDLQTMGNAAADQLQDLKLGAMDEESHDDDQYAGEMDLDEPEDQDIDTMPLPQESLDRDGEKATQGAIMSKRMQESQMLPDGEGLTVDESIVEHEPLDPEHAEKMRQELETIVTEWREEGRDLNKARDLWQRYENLTHDLALGLCEQLRLILEPTLATKLKGDYRTGKRLNMKKIIPYIASQFKKDKIWLRRTKPSKRQYQVMISIDDSKSMSESHSVQLAYESLSLISKALTQLEVGDISITSFGEHVRLLHPFDQPFSAEAGASVLQQFTFAQQKTQVQKLIESTISLFENAKHTSSGSSELWQLQLIISDGICENHELLQSLVRTAMEQQIMIIFIVVDNKPEKDSILNMTNVKYTTVNGKLSLQMTPYLESFPFQYFMVLRDINALPEALSDALRQYFSFVSG